jgi:hypothetical protein
VTWLQFFSPILSVSNLFSLCGGTSSPLCRHLLNSQHGFLLFLQMIGYTTISSTLDPRKVANLLDRLYQEFDRLSDMHDLYKVETIGDAYMCCGNRKLSRE